MIDYEHYSSPGQLPSYYRSQVNDDLKSHSKEQIIEAYIDLLEAYCEELAESESAKDLVKIIKQMVIS